MSEPTLPPEPSAIPAEHLLFEPPADHRHSASPTAALTPMRVPTRPEERNWAVAAHLSGFVAAYVALGFIGPLVVMLTGGTRSAYVRRHAVEALNFNLSVLIYLVVSGLLAVVLIGLPLLVAVGILYVVASIRGAVAAGRGEEYRYPMSIRFVG